MDSEQHNHNQSHLPAWRTGNTSFETLLVNRQFDVYVHMYYMYVYTVGFLQFGTTFHIHFRTGSAVQRRALAFTHSLVIARPTKAAAPNCSVEPRTVEPATQLVSQKYWVNNIWVPNILGPIGSSSKSKSNCSVEPATQLVSDKDMDGSLVFCGSLGEVTRHPVSR